jgi:hypothetical protein
MEAGVYGEHGVHVPRRVVVARGHDLDHVTIRFIGGRNRSTRKKTTHLPQFADIIDHIMLDRVHLEMSGIQIHKWCK